MTNGEIELICGAITGAGVIVGGVIRFLGRGVITAIDDAKVAVNRNTDATIKFVEVATKLDAKLDQVHAAALRSADAVEEVADEISSAHHQPEPFEPFEIRTPAGGDGGGSPLGTPGEGNGTGQHNASGFCAGGGGTTSSTASNAGGTSAQGVIVIDEYR